MHLSRLPSGRWRVAVKHNGRRATATRRTKSEAQQAGAELLIRLGGTPGRDHAVTVAELVALWFSRSELSITYRADATSAIDRHLPAAFAGRTLATVTPAVIEGLYAEMADHGASVHRVHRVHSVLSSAWTMAQRYGWANSNPFAVADKPPAPRPAIRTPTADELVRLYEHTPTELLLYLEVAETIGARRGELVGLQWDDVGDQALNVRRARSYAAGQFATTEGKSGKKGHRVIAIDDELAAALRAHRVEQVALALASGLPSPVWVFSHDAGVTPWRPEWPTKRFAKIRTAAGVGPEVKLHGMRHAMVTRLLGAGVPLPVVSERAGHTRVATTADRYGDYVPAADQAAAEIMAGLRVRRSV